MQGAADGERRAIQLMLIISVKHFGRVLKQSERSCYLSEGVCAGFVTAGNFAEGVGSTLVGMT